MRYLTAKNVIRVVNIIGILAILTLALMPVLASAQGIFPPGFQAPSQFERSDRFSVLVSRILNILLLVVGLIAVIFLVWGGFKYITAGGDEEAVDKAKKTIFNALIGVVVVLLALALVRIVSNAILGGPSGL